jgi:hypothetical protein
LEQKKEVNSYVFRWQTDRFPVGHSPPDRGLQSGRAYAHTDASAAHTHPGGNGTNRHPRSAYGSACIADRSSGDRTGSLG